MRGRMGDETNGNNQERRRIARDANNCVEGSFKNPAAKVTREIKGNAKAVREKEKETHTHTKGNSK